MLALTRKRGESITVDLSAVDLSSLKPSERQLVFTVVAVAGSNVRIGVEAPRAIPIRRSELRAETRQL